MKYAWIVAVLVVGYVIGAMYPDLYTKAAAALKGA